MIDWQLNGRTDHTYIFDDRGFLSSIRYYTADGNEWYQDYFDLAGQKQFRQYFNGQGVDIFPGANCDFAKQHYQDMDEVLAERIQVFSQQHLSPKDTVVVTANKRHNDLFVGRVPAKLALSFFNNRYDLTDEDQLTKLLDQVDLASGSCVYQGSSSAETVGAGNTSRRGYPFWYPLRDREKPTDRVFEAFVLARRSNGWRSSWSLSCPSGLGD